MADIKTIQDINKIIYSGAAEQKSSSDVPDILIVDDDQWTHRIFGKYLTEWGFNPISAMNSFEGLNSAIKYKPALIFLDIVMSELPGEIILKILKNLEMTSDIPVVIISANLNKELLSETYKSGASGFISKPFTQKIIYESLKKSLRPSIYDIMKEKGFALLD
jgi:twitching motility two-component system response regulator PilH